MTLSKNSNWLRHDRERDRRLASFYGKYFREVFRGGRHRWESVAFWLAVVVAGASTFPNVTTWMRVHFGDVSLPLQSIPAYIVVAVIVIRAVLAPAWISAEQAKTLEDNQKVGWVIQFPGGIDDVSVHAQPRKERYAVVNDIVITNHSPTNGISLNAELEIQYGVTTLVREAYGIPVEAWARLLVAFGMSPKAQLLFPLNIPPQGSVEGHIVFAIDPNGAGTGVGGDVPEKREYRVRFTDRLSDHRQTVTATSVVAPKLNNPQWCSSTDLATRGPSEDAWTRA